MKLTSSKKKTSGVSDIARELVAKLNKQFGVGSVYVASEATGLALRMFSTGVYRLDFALGGGIPEGRQTEIYGLESAGKTTLLLSSMAQFQKKYPDGLCVLVDFEKTFDLAYSIRLGVDPDRLLIILPDFGEQGVDMIKAALSQPVHVYVGVDSIAAIVASSTMEKSAGDAEVGVQARIINRMVAVCNARSKRSLSDSDFPTTTIVYLNQIREKVGVMFGCSREDTTIPFTDGTGASIRDVVEKKLRKKVWAYDEKSQTLVPSPITGWYNNGAADKPSDFIQISTEAIDSRNGKQGAQYTLDHKVLTPQGWRCARTLKIGDCVMSGYDSILNGKLREFVFGMVVGDCHLHGPHKNKAIQLADYVNPEYVEWKKAQLSCAFDFSVHPLHSKTTGNTYEVWTSQYTYELGELSRKIGKRRPSSLLSQMTPLSFAVWYMDDGSYGAKDHGYATTLSVKRLRGNLPELTAITQRLGELGFDCTFNERHGYLRFTAVGADRFHRAIARYVPACMQYKLPEKYRGKYAPFRLSFLRERLPTWVRVIRLSPGRSGSSVVKYDIEVRGYRNYLAGGVRNGFIVHNSPETTPGGKGKNFFASLRLKLFSSNSKANKIIAVKDVAGIKRNVLIGKVVSFEIIKTKTGSAPNEVGEYRYFVKNNGLYNAWTYDNLDALFEYGVFHKVIGYSNGYEYQTIHERKKENFLSELAKDSDYQEEIYAKIIAAITRSNLGEEDLDEAEVEEV